MKEIQELMNNKELLHKISESDKESPYEMKTNHRHDNNISKIRDNGNHKNGNTAATAFNGGLKQAPNGSAKKVSIEDQPTAIYSADEFNGSGKSPRPVRMFNNNTVVENGRSPRLTRRALDRSPMRTIRPIEQKINSNGGSKLIPKDFASNGKPPSLYSPRNERKPTDTLKSSKKTKWGSAEPPSQSLQDLHNSETTEVFDPPPPLSPSLSCASSISSKASSLNNRNRTQPTGGVFENPTTSTSNVYGTSIQSFHTPSPKRVRGMKRGSLRPRIEDDIYDDIDIRKTPDKGMRRVGREDENEANEQVLVNNNTPEDDVIDSPFQMTQNMIIQNAVEEEDEEDDVFGINSSFVGVEDGEGPNAIMLEKESLQFASFCNSSNSLEAIEGAREKVSGSIDCSMMTPPPPPLIDMEGEGCKCPKKLRCLLEAGFFLFLVCYVIATPYVMYITYENLESSEAKLREIEIPLRNHLEFGPDTIRSMKSTSVKDDDEHSGEARNQKNKTMKRKQKIITLGFGEYKSLDDTLDQRMEEIKKKLDKVTKRFVDIISWRSLRATKVECLIHF